MEDRAIRLIHWDRIYTSRWSLDLGDIADAVYGSDFIPFPKAMRQRMDLVHEIAKLLDQLLPREEQSLYWTMPLPLTLAPPYKTLRSCGDGNCLEILLWDLRQKVALAPDRDPPSGETGLASEGFLLDLCLRQSSVSSCGPRRSPGCTS